MSHRSPRSPAFGSARAASYDERGIELSPLIEQQQSRPSTPRNPSFAGHATSDRRRLTAGSDVDSQLSLQQLAATQAVTGSRHFTPGFGEKLGCTGFVALALVVLGLLVHSKFGHHSLPGAAPTTEDDSSPEGRLQGEISATHDYRARPRVASGLQGAVAADHGRCSEQGVAVLQTGGNAVDAAITTALCQGIYNPQASGIGGGALILIRAPNGTVDVIDAREVAPAAATTDMFTGRPPEASIEGGLAIGVPLELKGLWLAHQRHGRSAWADLVQPAAQLARSGFPAHPYLINSLTTWQDRLARHPSMQEIFYIQDGESWRIPEVNETCCARPAFADLLDKIAAFGPSVLDGHAEVLADEIQEAGGVITAKDLLDAQPSIKRPLRAQVWDHEVLTVPPPSSGACVISALQVLSGYQEPLASADSLGVHRLVEAMKHAFALRSHIGDPGLCPPGPHDACFLNETALLQDMLSPDFAALLRVATSDTGPSALEVYGGRWNTSAPDSDDGGTSHLSVVDAQHGAVSMTTTINSGFGAKVMSASTGVIFNDQMDTFSLPGRPNSYHVQPSPANFIAPGRKPRSSTSPTMVLGPTGRLHIVIGASGGPRIVSTLLQVLVRLLALGDDPLAAVLAPRLHHQLLPDVLAAESWTSGGLSLKVDDQVIQALKTMGHNVTSALWSGVCQAIVLNPDSDMMTSVSDPRKDGAPCAY